MPEGYDSVEEFKTVVEYVDAHLNASPKHTIINKELAGGTHMKGIDYDVLGFLIFKGEDVTFTHKLVVINFGEAELNEKRFNMAGTR